MELISHLISFILHIDDHLIVLFNTYGLWIYLILFLIIFCETGLVVTPFLPGDSLLFAVGALAASTGLSIGYLFFILIGAAILGDNSNYWLGYFIGPKVFRAKKNWLFNQAHLKEAQQFYDKHGSKAVVYARFVPIVRTFAPFVAGIGKMKYLKFITFSIGGGLLWVSLFLSAGYLFGNIPIVREHFSHLILGIIVVSLLPIAWEIIRERTAKK
jgi:membrane-associated protein